VDYTLLSSVWLLLRNFALYCVFTYIHSCLFVSSESGKFDVACSLILKVGCYIIPIKFYEINFEDHVISKAVVWDVTPSSKVDMMVQTAGSSKTLALHVCLPDTTALHSISFCLQHSDCDTRASQVQHHEYQGAVCRIPHSNGSDSCNLPT